MNSLMLNLTSVFKQSITQPMRSAILTCSYQPTRNITNIVTRTHTARLRKSHKQPSLRRKHFVYETIQNNVPTPAPKMSVLLTKYIANVGSPGEIVSVRPVDGRFYLLTKHAVYPTDENVAKHRVGINLKDSYSSKYVKTTLESLSRFVLQITMNKDTPWTLEPWHVKTAFRKAFVIVPESAITMPKYPITGPDLSLEQKEFYVSVTINKTEKCFVRCRIFHWTSNQEERLPFVKFPWKYPREPLFEEDRSIAEMLPAIVPPELDEDGEIIDPKKARAKRI